MGKHRKKQAKSKGTRQSAEDHKSTHFVSRIAGLSGVAFIIAGWEIMPIPHNYGVGLALAICGWVLCIYEVIREPELIRRPYQIQVVLIGAIVAAGVVFVIHVVPASAALEVESYAMRRGSYADGVVIGGIKWDPHFTDMRVVIGNHENQDYESVDIAIQPDTWVHAAAIIGNNPGCNLVADDGDAVFWTVTKEGGTNQITMHHNASGFEPEDDAGDVFQPLATKAPYRLRCGLFPRRFAIKIVFAAVAFKKELSQIEEHRKPLKPGEWGAGAFDIGKRVTFDGFADRPSPSKVSVKGVYLRQFREFSIDKQIGVQEGN